MQEQSCFGRITTRVLQSGELLPNKKPDPTKDFPARHQGEHLNIYSRTDMMLTTAMVMIIPHHICAFTAGYT